MSNDINQQIQELISEYLDTLWQLPSRPDLQKDCAEFIWEESSEALGTGIDREDVAYYTIKFLSTKCADALSDQDLKYMAKEYENA